jgi:hypothetical protein
MKKGTGLTQHPHPFHNQDVQLANGPNFIKISPCVIFLCGIPHNDIVVSICRHLYHPWCALIHFKHSSQCTNSNYKTIMSLEWSKSLGYKEFGKDMYKKEVLEGVKRNVYIKLNLKKQATMAYYPNVGGLHFSYISFLIFHLYCYLDCHACCSLMAYRMILFIFCIQCMSSNILQISFLVELKQFLNHGKKVWLHELNPSWNFYVCISDVVFLPFLYHELYVSNALSI